MDLFFSVFCYIRMIVAQKTEKTLYFPSFYCYDSDNE